MNLRHLGHATVLIETAQVRILVDPGNFSPDWHDLSDLDAILVTHSHPDHIDPQWVPALLERNPNARLLVQPDIPDIYNLPGAERFPAGTTTKIAEVLVEGVGGLHAVIHRDIPRIGNVGMVVTEPDGVRFFHPGDCLDTVPPDVDILALPAHGPWCAMKETIDFARAVNASRGFLIHDGLINQRGWTLTFSRLNEMTETVFTDLRDGRAMLNDIQDHG